MRSLGIVLNPTPEVDTSNLATASEMRELASAQIRVATGIATGQDVYTLIFPAIERWEKSDPNLTGNADNTGAEVGSPVFWERGWKSPFTGNWDRGVGASEFLPGGTMPIMTFAIPGATDIISTVNQKANGLTNVTTPENTGRD
jgi:hypothetical protein